MFSRVSTLLRARKILNNPKVNLQSARNSHNWNYRSGCKPSAKTELYAEVICAVAWWWILWHLVTEPGHVFGGEFPYPNASKWTNQELGIPED